MNRTNGIIGMVTETPLHPGTGQNLGAIDLPIQRERHTGYPTVPSSSLKGVLRSLTDNDVEARVLFGSALGEKDLVSGSLSLSDCRILAIPVRALEHVFFWVTAPYVLQRLKRDLALIGTQVDVPIPDVKDGQALIAKVSKVREKLVLEDLILDTTSDDAVAKLAAIIADICLTEDVHSEVRKKMARDLVVVSDAMFAHFVNYSTHVVARNQLDEGKRSKNLWYSEVLPTDSLLYASVMVGRDLTGSNLEPNKSFDILSKALSGKYIQLGGNETIGHGWCSVTLHPLESLKEIFAQEVTESEGGKADNS
ncbi:MAG: type III-B CRISPR module RAMP protein Cmr4 [Candidatus Thorarchaeota archaeon]|nr:MAG: type III-B CRISPR module RAMP protein Cmr4 [Candidatus Thorarchaeota archaeon]